LQVNHRSAERVEREFSAGPKTRQGTGRSRDGSTGPGSDESSMKNVGFLYDEVFLRHEPPVWHPDSPDRLVSIIVALKASGLWPKLLPITPRRATVDDLGRVHTREYIEKIITFGAGELDPDTYLSEGTLDAALHAAGAVMEAVERCRKNEISRAFCAIRPPGHHAEADQGMGF
jgi:acetoin utilization deacetylase AcuC-like enzyme